MQEEKLEKQKRREEAGQIRASKKKIDPKIAIKRIIVNIDNRLSPDFTSKIGEMLSSEGITYKTDELVLEKTINWVETMPNSSKSKGANDSPVEHEPLLRVIECSKAGELTDKNELRRFLKTVNDLRPKSKVTFMYIGLDKYLKKRNIDEEDFEEAVTEMQIRYGCCYR